MSDRITVEIDGPKVFVNGQLVAEHAVGQTNGRDELERNLSLHRIADVLLDRLDKIHSAAEGLTDDEADSFGRGLADGLRGRVDKHPQLPIGTGGVPREMADRHFKAGWDAGRSVAALRKHLQTEAMSDV